MKSTRIEKNPYTQLVYRPFWISMSCLLIILATALTILINSSWSAVHRTEPLKAHMAMIEEIQFYNTELNNLKPKLKLPLTRQIRKRLVQFNLIMMNMLNTSIIISDEARQPLLALAQTLENIYKNKNFDLSSADNQIQTALHSEIRIQNNLLRLLNHDNQLELKTTTFIAILLPVLGLLMLFFLRHRILRPLDNLSLLISRVGHQSLEAVSLAQIDPLLKPIFIDFNQLIERLAELERTQLKHQLELEDKVRHATQSLMEHQHTLTQSERLAAVGELTAGLAHELRNPLAGIHLTLENLKNETNDSDKVSRLTLVIEEIDRITKLLNQVLEQSRHSPEPATQFNLAELLDSLLKLVSYQIPTTIKLEHTIDGNIQCHLPPGRLKQAILNLVLNSARSIGNSPGHISIKSIILNDSFSILVFDTGKGFPENMLKHGVQPFVSGQDLGTGLGLSIVRRFCYELGGEIILTNTDTGSACVELKLPGNSLYE